MQRFAYTSSLVAVLILSGCAHKIFLKNGATKQDWARDNNDCLVKANQAGYRNGQGMDFGSTIAKNNFIQQCLEGQGWELQN